MELKRTILAVALSMAVLVVFQKYFGPKTAPETAQVEQPSMRLDAPPAPAQPGAIPTASGVAPEATQQPARQLQVTKAVLANSKISVTMTNRGAAVTEAELKDYRDQAGPGAKPVQLLAAPSGLDLAGATLLVGAAPEWSTVYAEVERSPTHVTYSWTGPTGLGIEKSYRLEPDRHDLTLLVRVTNGTAQAVRDRLGLVMVQDFSGHEDKYSFAGPAYSENGQYEEVAIGDLDDGIQASGNIPWVSFLEKYFLVAVVPETEAGNGLAVGTHLDMEKVAQLQLTYPVFDLAPGEERTFSYRIYFGPKKADVLAPLGSHLEDLVNYGFFHVIAKPLDWFLQTIYAYTGNYGIAIILLTVVIKAIFWPLSARSFKSMQRMKELQPKIQKLRERYGKDRERLSMETMQLYKTHKVNPLGGCLPMLVQIPFFFALYKILLGSIELRHAPFLLWIQDLSVRDPYYVTPLLMGASMFLQQKMTPVSGGNETQMKMMMYGMPVIFTFLFLNFPAGLVIYWLTNNILSIAQQGMMLKKAKAQGT
jgi:YidC/Oxa1 family membrane protein insertase